MTNPLTLTQLLDDAALLSLEHQIHLSEVLGEHSWHVDLKQGRLEFTGEHPVVCGRVHLIGSAAPGPRSWLWSWANPAGFPEQVTGLAAYVRDFGSGHGIPELASPEVPFDALPGQPAEPNQVAGILLEATKVVSGTWTGYTGDAGGGTRIAMLAEHQDFLLPAPEPARVMRVIQQSLAELVLTDHRRAIHSYATRRQLGATFNQDYSQLRLTGPRIDFTVHFGEGGRVNNVTGTMGGAAVP